MVLPRLPSPYSCWCYLFSNKENQKMRGKEVDKGAILLACGTQGKEGEAPKQKELEREGGLENYHQKGN